MLHRSASSRRRRASPSVANLSQTAGASSTMRGRRASVATEKPIVLPSSPGGTMERQRSPRGSMVPNIALDTESDSPDEVSIYLFYICISLKYIQIYIQMYIWAPYIIYKYFCNYRLSIKDIKDPLTIFYFIF